MGEIEKLWSQFRKLPFPRDVAGEEIDGIDLVSIETFLAGCISTFLGSAKTLDLERTRILKKCMEDLEQILPKLSTENQNYFTQLHHIGNLVIKQLGCS